jgi:hypothetical protein
VWPRGKIVSESAGRDFSRPSEDDRADKLASQPKRALVRFAHGGRVVQASVGSDEEREDQPKTFEEDRAQLEHRRPEEKARAVGELIRKASATSAVTSTQPFPLVDVAILTPRRERRKEKIDIDEEAPEDGRDLETRSLRRNRACVGSPHDDAPLDDARRPRRGLDERDGRRRHVHRLSGPHGNREAVGAGGGVLLLAVMVMLMPGNVQRINMLKVLLQMTANASAIVAFISAGIHWGIAASMGAGSVVGGFVGMRVANRLPAKVLHFVILAVGAALTVAYFVNVYGHGQR